MKSSLESLLKILSERHGKAVFSQEYEKEEDFCEQCFNVISESMHLIALEGFSAFLEKRVFARELADSSTAFLYEPSVANITRFQSQLFSRYTPIFGLVFPLKFQGKDLIPLYLKKYLQILDEFSQLSLQDNAVKKSPEGEKILFEALTFLANNWTPVVVHLKPSQNVPESPEVIPLSKSAPPQSKIKSVSAQIEEGLYFVPEFGKPLFLYPFLHNENDRSFFLRMLTKEGAFFRCLDGDGFRLFLSPNLLLEFGDILFRQGAYDKALSFYRLGGSQNREVLIMASALSHCINAVQLIREGEHLRAAAEYELAIAVRPDLPILYHELAKAYEAGNNLQQAASVINKLLERFPVSDEGYIALGDIYAAKGDWARANRAYEKKPRHQSASSRHSAKEDPSQKQT